MITGFGCGAVEKVECLLRINKSQLIDFLFNIRRQMFNPSYL
jgi:hypothetical protein